MDINNVFEIYRDKLESIIKMKKDRIILGEKNGDKYPIIFDVDSFNVEYDPATDSSKFNGYIEEKVDSETNEKKYNLYFNVKNHFLDVKVDQDTKEKSFELTPDNHYDSIKVRYYTDENMYERIDHYFDYQDGHVVINDEINSEGIITKESMNYRSHILGENSDNYYDINKENEYYDNGAIKYKKEEKIYHIESERMISGETRRDDKEKKEKEILVYDELGKKKAYLYEKIDPSKVYDVDFAECYLHGPDGKFISVEDVEKDETLNFLKNEIDWKEKITKNAKSYEVEKEINKEFFESVNVGVRQLKNKEKYYIDTILSKEKEMRCVNKYYYDKKYYGSDELENVRMQEENDFDSIKRNFSYTNSYTKDSTGEDIKNEFEIEYSKSLDEERVNKVGDIINFISKFKINNVGYIKGILDEASTNPNLKKYIDTDLYPLYSIENVEEYTDDYNSRHELADKMNEILLNDKIKELNEKTKIKKEELREINTKIQVASDKKHEIEERINKGKENKNIGE